MGLAAAVLGELERQPSRRTDLERCVVRKSGTHATFEGILHYLVQGGFVVKSEQRHRADYVVTEKGRKLLEALT
jgi:DNA-binding PadR family transcriptional regulator